MFVELNGVCGLSSFQVLIKVPVRFPASVGNPTVLAIRIAVRTA